MPASRGGPRVRVIPVLDLSGGIAVHARGGDRSRYAPVRSRLAPGLDGDARALARAYRERLGLGDALYVADLDALRGGSPQRALLRALADDGARTWVDRGIATPEAADAALADGATRVIVGLETLPSLDLLGAIVAGVEETRGGAEDGTVFSLDLRHGRPLSPDAAIARRPAIAVAESAAAAGVRTMIVLDLARVGTGAGVDAALIGTLVRALPGVAIIAGGGIGGPADLARLADAGAWGALVGSVLHGGAASGTQESGDTSPIPFP